MTNSSYRLTYTVFFLSRLNFYFVIFNDFDVLSLFTCLFPNLSHSLCVNYYCCLDREYSDLVSTSLLFLTQRLHKCIYNATTFSITSKSVMKIGLLLTLKGFALFSIFGFQSFQLV